MSNFNAIDALHPQFFEDWSQFREIISNYGSYKGRYLADFPANNWQHQVIDFAAEHMNDIDAAKLRRILDRYCPNGIHSMLINLGWEYDSDNSWRMNTDKYKANKTFRNTVPSVFERDKSVTFEDIIFDLTCDDNASTSVSGKTGEYIELIRPLLKKGPAAYFIDPYCWPLEDGYRNFIKRVIEESLNSDCYRLYFYSRFNEYGERGPSGVELTRRYREKIIEEFQPSMRRGKIEELVFHFVNDSKKKPELHNRYFLTKYGAIDFGKGFGQFNLRTTAIEVQAVQRNNHEKLRGFYIDNKAEFSELDRVRITPL